MPDDEDVEVPPPGFLARDETYLDDRLYYKNPEDATHDRNFQSDRFGKPYQLATIKVDQAQDKLVNALVYAFTAHMGAKEASFSADMDEISKAQFILKEAKELLKDDLKEVYNTLAINDGAILLILNKINRELHNIKIDDDDDDDPLNKIAMNDIISTIVNENIRYDEVTHIANRVRLNGGKTNRKKRTHRKNKKHKTNRRKHKTNRRKHRKTRKN